MELEFENIGKFIQRNNLALIFFCTFSLVASIQISQFNKNLQVAEALKSNIITDQSSLFEHIKKALTSGSSNKNALWVTRFKDDDLNNLINHELSTVVLSQWFDTFWQKEENEESAIELQQAFFLLTNIAQLYPSISNITGNKVSTIEAAIGALDSHLNKREIKNIKLPVIGSEISVSLLSTIVPLVQIAILIVVSSYLLMASKLIKTTKNASELLSNTVLYLTDYDTKTIYYHLFKITRLTPSFLMLGVIYSYELIGLSSWQMYFTFVVIIMHIYSFLVLDKAIISVIMAQEKSANN